MPSQRASQSEWCVLCGRSDEPATRELPDGCLAHPGCADDPVFAELLPMHAEVTDQMSDVQDLRDYLDREGVDHSQWDDERLETVIARVKLRIGGRRWSWKVLAENLLCEGRMFREDEVTPL